MSLRRRAIAGATMLYAGQPPQFDRTGSYAVFSPAQQITSLLLFLLLFFATIISAFP